MKVRKVICVALIILLAGCNGRYQYAENDNGRYQFTAVENGRQIGVLTDTTNGDSSICYINKDAYIYCDWRPSQQ